MDTTTGSDQIHRPSYTLNGKVALAVTASLIFTVFLLLFFHLYGRWYTLRRGRMPFLLFYLSNGSGDRARGVDPEALGEIPVVARSGKEAPAECAVCLSEIIEGEKARVLPKCRHVFHVECVDLWFSSHATCPLCRTIVSAAAAAAAAGGAAPMTSSPVAGAREGDC